MERGKGSEKWKKNTSGIKLSILERKRIRSSFYDVSYTVSSMS